MDYRIIKYIDVEQNEQGEWYVNGIDLSAGIISFEGMPKAKEVCQALKDLKVLETADMRKVGAEIGDDLIVVFDKKGKKKPICCLNRIKYDYQRR